MKLETWYTDPIFWFFIAPMCIMLWTGAIALVVAMGIAVRDEWRKKRD